MRLFSVTKRNPAAAASAEPTLIPGYTHVPGHHCGSTALATAMHQHDHGRAHALRLAEEGADIVISARTGDTLEATRIASSRSWEPGRFLAMDATWS